MKDYYGTLGLKFNASQDQIKEAFRELALRYHPDRNHSPGAEAMMKEINDAYSILNNPIKRAEYDAVYGVTFNSNTSGSYTYSGHQSGQAFNTSNAWNDLFKNMGIVVDHLYDESEEGQKTVSVAAGRAIGDGVFLFVDWLLKELEKRNKK